MAEVNERRGALVKLAILGVLIVSGALAATLTPLGEYLSREGVGQAITWLRGSTAAPLIYIAVYAAATALAIPGSILTLAGGAMFGVLWGILFFGESPSAWLWVAVLLVGTGVALVNFGKPKSADAKK